MILEVRHLRIVHAIAAEGTVTGAAERLHLTQPAISHALRELEGRLGVQLFRRTHRRMEPTTEGRRVLRAGEVVLEELTRAEEDILAAKQGTRGALRVATQCYTCYHWVPKTLPELHERFPNVDLQIVPEATADPVAALLDEKIDLAIVHRLPEHGEIALEPLFTDEFVGIVAPGHPLAGREWIEPEDFADERLLLHTRAEQSLLMNRWLLPAGVRPERISTLGLSEAIFESVRAGQGVSAVAAWMVADEIAAGRLAFARLAPGGLTRHWHAASLRKRQSKPAMVELVRLLRAQQPASPVGV